MPTWTDEQILRWMKDAEDDIVAKVYMRFESFSIAIESGTALYTLNRRIYRPVKLMWKGKEISPYIGREIHATSPQFRTVQGEPTAYQMFGDGVTQLRLIPVPDTSIPEYTTGLYDTNIENAFIIRAYTFPDTDVDYFQIPDYVYRNLVKCYVLYRAFNAEGIGQNLKAAEFWSSRYSYFMSLLAKARGKYYNGKERLDNDFFLSQRKRRHARLPGDFTISKPVFPLVSVASDGFTLSDSAEASLELAEGFLVAGGSDDLNNWSDSVSSQIFPGPLASGVGDDLNNWNDAVASEVFGFLSQSSSDTLNNWNDASAQNLATEGIPTDSLVVDLQMEEGSGQTVSDSSGNGYDFWLGSTTGSDANDPTWTTDSSETVLDFAAANNIFITGPDFTSEFSGATAGTIVYVLKVTTVTTSAMDTLSSTAHDNYHSFGGNLYHGVLGSARTLNNVAHVVTTTNWHVLFLTRNGAACTMHENGTLAGSASSGTFSYTNTAPKIGDFASAANARFYGRIKRATIYKKALSASERTQYYDAVAAAYPGFGL